MFEALHKPPPWTLFSLVDLKCTSSPGLCLFLSHSTNSEEMRVVEMTERTLPWALASVLPRETLWVCLCGIPRLA